MVEYKYVDHLTEYVKGMAEGWIRDHRDLLPQEFADLPEERIAALITEMSTPILRKIEDDVILAGIERAAILIRYSKKGGKKIL